MERLTPTLWVAGCSFAYGIGLPDLTQRYGQIVADQLKYTPKFLTQAGSSIEWAHNQIIHNNIKSNDIVLWGLTSLERFSFFDPDEYDINAMNITSNYREYSDALKLLFISDHTTIRNIRLIKQIQVLLDRNNTKLILFFHPELSLPDHGKLFFKEFSTAENLIVSDCTRDSTWNGTWPVPKRNFLDFGTDNMHPGPVTHRAWADQIVSFIKERDLS